MPDAPRIAKLVAMLRLVFWIAILSGCSLQTPDLGGLSCRQGNCIDGWECHPDKDICVQRIERACGGDGVCWSDVNAGGECEVDDAFLPCGDVDDCSAGCRTCRNGAWSACESESCDLGMPASCGACGDACSAWVANAIPACNTSGPANVCDYSGDCVAGTFDADGDRSNGCEYGCVRSNGGLEICDGLDNDCDGETDETGVASAVCGDGNLCSNAETCDDGFTDSCGTCNVDCSASGAGSTCGDGVVCDETEVCDDGYSDACGTCNEDCTGVGTDSTCGDKIVCPQTENCDDGFGTGCVTCYSGRKPIIIQSSQVVTNLIDFPVLISWATDAELAAQAQPAGLDIKFTADDGTTQLSHEIDFYDSSTGELAAWVKIPSLSTTVDTTLYMYYGDSGIADQQDVAGVWSNNFAGVWHMGEDPSITTDGDCGGGSVHLCDSGPNANHGMSAGSMTSTDVVAGNIGDAIHLDGSSGYFSIPSTPSLDITGAAITLSAWVYSTVNQNDDCGVIVKSAGNNYNYQLGIQGAEQANFRVNTSNGLTYLTGNTQIGQLQWYYIYGIYDGSTAKVYLDDQEDGTANNNGVIDSTTQPVLIGRRALGDNRFFEGYVDEVRIAPVARAVEWMQTEYNNQSSPGTFISVGVEETSW